MARKAAITPNQHVHTTIPADLGIRVELLLHSELEGKVPRGAWQDLIVQLLTQHLDHRSLDLSPFVGALPGIHVVRAPAQTLAALSALLRRSE